MSAEANRRYLLGGIYRRYFIFCVDGDAEEATTMTRTGEGILIGVSICTLFIALVISQTDWARGAGNPSQLQRPSQVERADADRLIPYD